MQRIQAQLTDAQARGLKELARDHDVSIAELIRRGVDLVLTSQATTTAAQRQDRALSAVGRFASDADDVALRHDRYLLEAYHSEM